jgi:hypothetical protein
MKRAGVSNVREETRVCHDAVMLIEFVMAQCTSVNGADKWVWLALFPRPTLVSGDLTPDYEWRFVTESDLGTSDWERLHQIVEASLTSPSVTGGGGGNSQRASSWRRWRLRQIDKDWRLVPPSEPWPGQ